MKNKVLFIKKKEIDQIIQTLAQKIERDYFNKEIVFLCLLKSSIFFCADLMRKIHLKQKVDFIRLLRSESYRGKEIKLLKNVNVDIKNQHVLILVEVIEEGYGLSLLKDHLLSLKPKTLKTITLLDKPHSRKKPLRPDYIGRTIDDRFVIGYGMDYEEKGRNYKNIYHLMQ